MPKTYTEDVAAVLPASITGPIQVVKAGDLNSWIKLDPAGAKIAAAGLARPVRRLSVPALRLFGSGATTTIGSAIPAVSVSPTQLGGHYFAAIGLPPDMDVSQPSSVKVLVGPAQSATTNGQVVRFQLTECHVTDGGTRMESTVTYDWSVPDNWTANDHAVVLLDAGGGYSFAGGTFQQGQQLGLRAARAGSNSEDTFDKSLNIAEYAIFEYTAAEY